MRWSGLQVERAAAGGEAEGGADCSTTYCMRCIYAWLPQVDAQRPTSKVQETPIPPGSVDKEVVA